MSAGRPRGNAGRNVRSSVAAAPLLDWPAQAACARPGVDPEWFFPEQGESTRAARRICATCPVKAPCLDAALATPLSQDFGVRGGTSPTERLQLRARRRRGGDRR